MHVDKVSQLADDCCSVNGLAAVTSDRPGALGPGAWEEARSWAGHTDLNPCHPEQGRDRQERGGAAMEEQVSHGGTRSE